jgi:hypothetical protein
MVFLIAVAPALAVLFISFMYDTRRATVTAAIIAAAFGVLTGNPAYFAIDLVFVGLGLWLSLSLLEGRLKKRQAATAQAEKDLVWRREVWRRDVNEISRRLDSYVRMRDSCEERARSSVWSSSESSEAQSLVNVFDEKISGIQAELEVARTLNAADAADQKKHTEICGKSGVTPIPNENEAGWEELMQKEAARKVAARAAMLALLAEQSAK